MAAYREGAARALGAPRRRLPPCLLLLLRQLRLDLLVGDWAGGAGARGGGRPLALLLLLALLSPGPRLRGLPEPLLPPLPLRPPPRRRRRWAALLRPLEQLPLGILPCVPNTRC